MRVLCVSGDRRVVYLIRHVLQFEGHHVAIARSLAEALERLDERPGLLVVAPPLPDADPERAAAALRDAGAGARLLVLEAPSDDAGALIARLEPGLGEEQSFDRERPRPGPPARTHAGPGRSDDGHAEAAGRTSG